MSEQSFLLPWPPSVNSRKRFTKTFRIVHAPAHRVWQQEAACALLSQSPAPVSGRVEVEIQLGSPTKRAFDIDNRAKAILDLLVTHGIIEDDNNRVVRRLTLIPVDDGLCGAFVTVTKIIERGD